MGRCQLGASKLFSLWDEIALALKYKTGKTILNTDIIFQKQVNCLQQSLKPSMPLWCLEFFDFRQLCLTPANLGGKNGIYWKNIGERCTQPARQLGIQTEKKTQKTFPRVQATGTTGQCLQAQLLQGGVQSLPVLGSLCSGFKLQEVRVICTLA